MPQLQAYRQNGVREESRGGARTVTQLEAFVDKVRGREPVHWVSHQDSVDQMRTIDMVYEKSGLGKRRGTGQVE